MVNPIALILIVIGVLLLGFGMFLVTRRAKVAGAVISLLGLSSIAIPFVTGFYLAPNP